MDSQMKGNEGPLDKDPKFPSGSDQQSVGPEIPASQDGGPSSRPESAGGQRGALLVSRRATGPRTQIGKGISKYNALKHGLFANVVLLSFESRSEFNALSRGLERDLTPQTVLEKILVEKLATLFWRYRRFLQAENAELKRTIQLEQIEKCRRSDELADFALLVDNYLAQSNAEGLISKISDPAILYSCVDKLRGVCMELRKFGLLHDTHKIVLGRIYGARYDGRPTGDLFDVYIDCLDAFESDQSRQRKGFHSREDCLKRCVVETEKEIRRLEALAKQASFMPVAVVKSPRPEKEIINCTLPSAAEMERFTRYESSIERAIHRTLKQLESLQALRWGRALSSN